MPSPFLRAPTFTLSHQGRTLLLGGGVTRVMGVVNVTPDSFYARSRTPEVAAAVATGLEQVSQGAVIVDVGGESTRPGSKSLSVQDELARVLPVIERLAEQVAVSIDTYKAEVACQAVKAGAVLVNDVSGGLLDPGMAAAVGALGVPVIVGHLRGTPETMQRSPRYVDPVAEVKEELALRLLQFETAGVAPGKLLIDPGIGFGKRPADNLALIARLDAFHALRRPIVIGVSRKSFLSRVLSEAGIAAAGQAEERLEGSLAAAVLAAERGAALIRTHDVRATVRSLAIADAIVHGG